MKQFIWGELPRNASAVGVVMAGGHGTRFWPVSRSHRPKQYLPLTGGTETLIQQSVKRLRLLSETTPVIVVTSGDHLELARKQLPNVTIITEPVPRNTAPCLGLAAKVIADACGDEPIVCVPADQVIRNERAFSECITEAIELARSTELLVTIGITPDRVETGYGYIERGAPVGDRRSSQLSAFRATRFVEKPEYSVAKELVASGQYFWNSGMFIVRPRVLLEAIRVHLPELYRGILSLHSAIESNDGSTFAKVFSELPSISIDYGVMERAENVAVFCTENLGWSDVGSWSSWADELDREQELGSKADSNVIQGDGVFIDSTRCAVQAKNKKFVAMVGVADIVVIETDDALLICDRKRSQEVKKVTDYLKAQGRTELL